MLITPRGAVEQQAFRRIDEIVVGLRNRREISAITTLVASIRDDTQLQPIVIRSAGTLICGARRSQAAKLFGLTQVSVTVDARADPGAASLLRTDIEKISRRPTWRRSALISSESSANRRRLTKCVTAVLENYRNGSSDSEWRDFKIDDDCPF